MVAILSGLCLKLAVKFLGHGLSFKQKLVAFYSVDDVVNLARNLAEKAQIDRNYACYK